MYLMQPYDDALQEILDTGIEKKDRTGVGCISVAGIQKKYDISGEHFPIVTKRKMFPKSVFAELLWFISGSTLNQDLEALGAKFWGKWCDENNTKYQMLRKKWEYEPGDFGPIYGWQLRHFGADYIQYRHLLRLRREAVSNRGRVLLASGIGSDEEGDIYITSEMTVADIDQQIKECLAYGTDQLTKMVTILKNDPFGSDGRRCLFSLWNPNDLSMMALPPCHYTYQAVADGKGGLTGILTQRSCDFPVGVPANIQFYSALTIMLAQQAGMRPRQFIHNTGDSHIYLNQIDAVKEYLSRPRIESPKLVINKASDIFSYKMGDFEVSGYNPLEKMDIEVAV